MTSAFLEIKREQEDYFLDLLSRNNLIEGWDFDTEDIDDDKIKIIGLTRDFEEFFKNRS